MASDLIPPIVAALKADISNFSAGMKTATAQAGDTEKGVSGHFANLKTAVGGHWGSIVATVTGVISVTAVADFAKNAIDKYASVSAEVGKMARLTGDSVESMSRLRFAGEETGISTDQLDNAFKKLSKTVEAGAAANGRSSDKIGAQNVALEAQKAKLEALVNPTEAQKADLEQVTGQIERNTNALDFLSSGAEKYGIKLTDASGNTRAMHDILMDTATVFKDMPNGIDKNAMAMKLFGKQGTDLIPLLNKGAEGIGELEKESDKLGLTLGQKDVDAVKKNVIAKRQLHAAVEGLQVQVGKFLYPAFAKVSLFLSEHMAGAVAMVKQAFEWLAPKIQIVIDVISAVIDYLATHKDVLEAVAVAVGVVLVAAFLQYAFVAAQAAVATIVALAPFLAIAAAVAVVAAGVIYAYTHFAWFKATVDAVSSFLKDTLWPILETIGKVVIAGLIAYVKGVWLEFQTLWSVAKTVWEAVSGAVKTAWEVVIKPAFDAISAGVGDVIGFFQSIPEKIGEFFGRIFDLVTSPFKAAFNFVARLWNSTVGSISFHIPDWVPGIGGDGFSMPKIPEFDYGGIVPGMPGAPVLVLAHGGEEVISHRPGGNGSTSRGGGGVTFHNTFNHVGSDPAEISRTLAWQQKTRRNPAA